MKDTRIFALYKGDQYIMDGTCEQIAKARNCSVRGIKFLLTGVYKKRVENREKNRERSSKGCLSLVYLGEGSWGYGWRDEDEE